MANVRSEEFDVIVSDMRIPGITGLQVLQSMHQFDGSPPLILMTAFGDNATRAQPKRLGAAVMFDKPFDIGELLANVRKPVPPKGAMV